MGIIAWIVLGLGAGLLANMLIPGRRQQGLILTGLIGIAGALLGGWAATKIFHLTTRCRGSSTPPPGSPPSPAQPSSCSSTTWPRGSPAPTGWHTAEHREQGAAANGTHACRHSRAGSGRPEPARRRRYGLPASVSNSDPVGAENALTSRDLRMLVSEAMSADNPVTAVDLVSPAGPGNAKVRHLAARGSPAQICQLTDLPSR